MRLVRSNILQSIIFDMFFCWEGVSSSSKIIVETSFDFTKWWISSILPVPKKVFGFGSDDEKEKEKDYSEKKA